MIVFYIGIILIEGVVGYFTNTYGYTINTEGCQIQSYPLVGENIREEVSRPAARPVCARAAAPPLLQANDTHVAVVRAAYDAYLIYDESFFSCCYRNFSAQGNIENIAYGVCQEFTTDIKGQHEFVKVECYNAGSKIYEDLFRFNVYPPQIERKSDDGAFSVLMFGLDNVSRNNFMRTMGRTSSFLKKRSSIQLQGYNKVGDNSFPNLFPLLTGKSYEEVKETCFKNLLGNHGCKFLWDLYKRAGYRTAVGADSGAGVLGVYESLLRYKPADFYLQPFMYETRHVFRDRTYDYHICLHDRYLYMELLRFAEDVLRTVQQEKLFGLFWEESVSHHQVNYPFILDNDYYNVLTVLDKNKNLEDTVVIFFSDHGVRFGKILATEQGRLESRLPLFEIMFPVRFRRKYRLAFKNFEANSFRLTTANDVFETMLDLLNPSKIEDEKIRERSDKLSQDSKAISLFLPIPQNRTCKSLGIAEHWCACAEGETVPISSKGQSFAARYVMKYINALLSEFPMCQKLKLQKVIDVRASKDKLTAMKKFRVLVETAPGRGIFEATLVQENGLWALSGSVSRLNAYSDQSNCVKDPYVKNFCFCRNLKTAAKTHLFKT